MSAPSDNRALASLLSLSSLVPLLLATFIVITRNGSGNFEICEERCIVSLEYRKLILANSNDLVIGELERTNDG